MRTQQICAMTRREYYRYLNEQVALLEAKLEAAEQKLKAGMDGTSCCGNLWKARAQKAEQTIVEQSVELLTCQIENADLIEDIKQSQDTANVLVNDLIKAEQKLRKFVWGENNPSEYVNALDKAEATIKKTSELPEKWRYHGEGECNCLTCVCANELQATLNRSKS